MGMRMSIHQARQDEAPSGIKTVCVGRHLKDAPNCLDAVRLDENIGAFKTRVRAVQYMSTRHQECHRISSARTRIYHRHLGGIPLPAPPPLQYATEHSAWAGFWSCAIVYLPLYRGRQYRNRASAPTGAAPASGH